LFADANHAAGVEAKRYGDLFVLLRAKGPQISFGPGMDGMVNTINSMSVYDEND